MEQIKIIFFALASFFGIQDGRIASDKTTITIFPQNNQIEIIQERLFTVIQSEKDSILVVEQWNKILDTKRKNTDWAQELDGFPVKILNFKSINNTIQPHITLNYTEEKDLRVLGIWYNEEKNEFAINDIPQHNIKTNGKLDGNYWVFNAGETITFTIEPFLIMPKEYKKLKRPLNSVLNAEKN